MNSIRYTYQLPAIILAMVLSINLSMAQDCGCTNCPVLLPDNLLTQFNANIAVDNTTNNTLGVDNFLEQVCVEITHSWIGDLDITLVAPDGTSVLLYADGNNDTSLGGTGLCDCGNMGDNMSVCFVLPGAATNVFGAMGVGSCTAEAYQDPCNGSPCYNGSWGAYDEGCLGGNGIGAFNNGAGTVSGVWRLLINDNADGDMGILTDVTLVFATPPTGDCTTDPPDPVSSACQNAVGVPIPDNTGTPGISMIDVAGSAGTIGSGTEILSVCIQIEHTWIGDLDIWVYEPNGNGVNLSNTNGGADEDYGDVSTNTEVCFTPTATNPITGYSGGDVGQYAPEQPFSDFNGPPNGQWTLAVWDGAGTNVGSILSWSITFDNGDCSDECTVTGTVFDDFCEGTQYDFNGTMLSAGGIYTDTLPGARGCDSVVTLNLTENILQAGTFDTSVCIGETFIFNGTIYGGANLTGTEIFPDANGCDSTVTVTVTEHPVQAGVFDTTVCSG
ncbi:MAG: hypothetical protein GY751_02660, partial [Bacteroidetes bacterium]|nr:hypothetical protein [Bacteroidota bacterium]